MKMKHLGLALSLFAFHAALRAQGVAPVLARMDQAAPKFHAMTADIEMITYTAVLSDTTTEKGTLKMQRLKPNDVRAIIDFSGQTDARILGFFGKTVRIYYPNLQSFQDYQLGKNSQLLNQFLLLGFGSSGTDLARSYEVSLEGSEDVLGKPTAKLLLIPKDPKVKEHLSKIEMWIPNDAGYPVQQQFYEPSGNYRKATYSNIQINPLIQGTLELKIPSGVTKQTK
jgi:outer membrane lipoprotein-sorting protein